MHHNSTVFPEPEKFNPGRWLADNSVELEKYNVAFSKGTRNCIGMKYVSFIPLPPESCEIY